MIVYHGSDSIVDNPKILASERLLDFGAGFYTTTNQEQAVRWSKKVKIRRNTKSGFISVYDFNIKKAEKKLHIVQFNSPDESWLNFICSCRSGKPVNEEYDIAIGPVADDNVYTTVKLFETGVFDEDEAIRRLKVEALYDQVLFHTEKALTYCIFKEFIRLGDDISEQSKI
jgi:hypothetical protein